MRMIRFIFSAEFFFALFLTSGVFKASLNFPVDLTAFFLILTTILIFARLFRNPSISKSNILPLIIYFTFVSYILLSLTYTPNVKLGLDKFDNLIFLTTPSYIFSFLLFRNRESLIKFLLALGIIAAALSVFSLPMIFERGASIGFVGFNEGNYLGLTRVGGAGLGILIFLGLLDKRFKRYRVVFATLTIIVLISLLASGGRMPVIAVSLALLLGVLSSIKLENRALKYPVYLNKIIILFIIMLIPILWAYRKGFFNSLIFRFEVLLNEGGASASARTDRFTESIEIWKNNFLIGSGFGGFGHYYTNGMNHDYPHNIFLEVLSELGTIGILIFIGLLGIAIVRLLNVAHQKHLRSSNLFITVIITSLVTFFNAMVSGDLNGNRLALTFIAILCTLPAIFKEEKNLIH